MSLASKMKLSAPSLRYLKALRARRTPEELEAILNALTVEERIRLDSYFEQLHEWSGR